jgi:hypothetical protein
VDSPVTYKFGVKMLWLSHTVIPSHRRRVLVEELMRKRRERVETKVAKVVVSRKKGEEERMKTEPMRKERERWRSMRVTAAVVQLQAPNQIESTHAPCHNYC